MKRLRRVLPRLTATAMIAVSAGMITPAWAQQKEMPEVSILTAVPNFAFAAIWVAEELKYFEQEGVRIKITPAPSGSVCLNAVVGRSTNFCASTSEGLVLARVEGNDSIARSSEADVPRNESRRRTHERTRSGCLRRSLHSGASRRRRW